MSWLSDLTGIDIDLFPRSGGGGSSGAAAEQAAAPAAEEFDYNKLVQSMIDSGILSSTGQVNQVDNSGLMTALQSQVGQAGNGGRGTGLYGQLYDVQQGLASMPSGGGAGDNTQQFSDLNDYLREQFQGANDKRFDSAKANMQGQKYLYDQAIARENLATAARTNMGTNINTGFNDLGTAQQKGFDNMGEEFSLAQSKRRDLAAAAQTDRDLALAATRKDLTDGFAAGATLAGNNSNAALEQMQNNAKKNFEGQTGLADSLSDLSGNQDIYYGDLAANQSAMQGTQDGFVSSFQDYVDKYDDDTTLANQTRADIQTGLVNTAANVRDDLARVANNQAGVAGAVADVKDGTTDVVEQGFQDQSQQLSALGGIGQTTLDNQQGIMAAQGQGNEIANKISDTTDTIVNDMNAVRANLGTVTANMDANAAQNYVNMTKGFDEQGRLIRNQILDDGSMVNRNMDTDGMMTETYYSQGGTPTGTQQYNVGAMLGQGTSALMGGAQQQPLNGLMA